MYIKSMIEKNLIFFIRFIEGTYMDKRFKRRLKIIF